MRHVNISWFMVIFLSLLLKWTLSVHFIPERAEVTIVNDQYVYNVSSHINRFGRRSTYYFNLVLGLKHAWGNNITLHLSFFENQNNQYRSSFVEFHFKLCDMLQRDQYFGKLLQVILTKYHVPCPIPQGIMYQFLNVTLPSETFLNILPFQKGKVEISFTQLQTKEVMLTLSVTFAVKT